MIDWAKLVREMYDLPEDYEPTAQVIIEPVDESEDTWDDESPGHGYWEKGDL